MQKYEVNFSAMMCYDETSPTFLRWVIPRKGVAGSSVRRRNNGVAGSKSSNGTMVVNIDGKTYSIKKIVWILFNGKLSEKEILFVDGDITNCKISNLRLQFERDGSQPKYSSWLSQYFYYDSTSPSFLRWKAKYNTSSKVKIGDVAGTCDLDDFYWRINALGDHFKAHRIIWTLFNGSCPDGLHIDHIDGNPSNNDIGNLRVVIPRHNMHNKSMNKNNTSGTTGVSYSERTQPSGLFFSKYTAHMYVPNVGKRSKSFSIQKYGEQLAFELACEQRDLMIQFLNENGADYTDRHGK